eukprot:c33803_g1_i1 orf=241-483(+)
MRRIGRTSRCSPAVESLAKDMSVSATLLAREVNASTVMQARNECQLMLSLTSQHSPSSSTPTPSLQACCGIGDASQLPRP